jgi:hypothetical protein
MRVHRRYLPILVVLLTGCPSAAPRASVNLDGTAQVPTGIEGTVYRNPTRPVCQVDSPCNTPFSAGFEVWQSERVVTRFQSDSAGHFLVHLAPGRYTVALDSTSGILMRSQVHEVLVESAGLTHVEWEFDTGIR